MTRPDKPAMLAFSKLVEPDIDGKGADLHLLSAPAAVSRVKRGGLIAFFVYSAGYAVTYFSQLVVARLIGANDYGVFAYVSAWATVLIYISTLGFDVALLRFMPVYRARQAWSLLQGVVRYARRNVAALGTLLGLASAGMALVWSPQHDMVVAFLIGFATVPVVALLRVQCAILRATGAVVAALAPDRIVREGTLMALVAIGTLGLGCHFTASMALAAALTGALAGLVLANVYTRSRRLVPADAGRPESDAAAWRRAALPLMVAGAAEVLLNRTGVMVLGWFGDREAAGAYSLAFNIALIVTLPRIAANTLFAPVISSLHSVGDNGAMQALVARTASWTLLAGAVITAVLFAIAGPLMHSFGPEYGEGVTALRILLVAQVLAAGAGSQLYLMTMTGNERGAAVLLVAAAAWNVAAGIVLVQHMGIVGAAVGSAAILLLWNIAMAVWIWRHLRLLPGIMSLRARRPKDI